MTYIFVRSRPAILQIRQGEFQRTRRQFSEPAKKSRLDVEGESHPGHNGGVLDATNRHDIQ
jgi:hypothetical protein